MPGALARFCALHKARLWRLFSTGRRGPGRPAFEYRHWAGRGVAVVELTVLALCALREPAKLRPAECTVLPMCVCVQFSALRTLRPEPGGPCHRSAVT